MEQLKKVTVLVTVLVLALSGCGHQERPAARLTPQRVNELEREVRSKRVSEIRDAIVVPAGVGLNLRGVRALGASLIMLEPDSFRKTGAGAASMEARKVVRDRKETLWRVSLRLSHGRWRIVGTQELQ